MPYRAQYTTGMMPRVLYYTYDTHALQYILYCTVLHYTVHISIMRTILDILHCAYFIYILNSMARYYAQNPHHTVSYYTHCPVHTSRSIRYILHCTYNTRHTTLNISYFARYTLHTFPDCDVTTVHTVLYILRILDFTY